MSIADDEIREFLQQYVTCMGDRWNMSKFKYRSWYDLILQHGKAYEPSTLASNITRGLVKQCFHNAFKLATRRKLLYVEGFALGAFIPVLHAWCVAPGTNQVIDPTWTPAGSGYFGVPIKLSYRRAAGGGVMDQWEKGWPILKITTNESDWKQEEET